MGVPYEYPQPSVHTVSVLQRLLYQNRVNNIPYASITLTCPELVTDVSDPEALIQRESMALLWTKGHPTDESVGNFEVVRDGEPDTAAMAESTRLMRQLVLGASIGEAALGRVSPAVRRIQEDYELLQPGRAALTMADMCSQVRAPFGVCQLGEVVAGSVMPEGAKHAMLWYPVYVPAQSVLDKFKETVQGIIRDETV